MDDNKIIALFQSRNGDAVPPDHPPRLSIGRRRNTAGKRGGTQYELSLEELEECAASELPEQEADAELLAEVISSFLWDCKEEARTVFIRRYYFCDSIKYIAKGEKMSESNVKATLTRTRKALKKRLEKEGFTV